MQPVTSILTTLTRKLAQCQRTNHCVDDKANHSLARVQATHRWSEDGHSTDSDEDSSDDNNNSNDIDDVTDDDVSVDEDDAVDRSKDLLTRLRRSAASPSEEEPPKKKKKKGKGRGRRVSSP